MLLGPRFIATKFSGLKVFQEMIIHIRPTETHYSTHTVSQQRELEAGNTANRLERNQREMSRKEREKERGEKRDRIVS